MGTVWFPHNLGRIGGGALKNVIQSMLDCWKAVIRKLNLAMFVFLLKN